MRVPEDVFEDFKGRRKGILRALTTDVDRLYEECDPEAENLCLYGNPDGQWVVDLPAEEVPPEMPEPSLGINFSRAGMIKKDWLLLVAVHSDTWLYAVAFYNGARLNKDGRERLFELINDLPTCYEIVSGRSSQAASRPSNRKRAPAPMARPGPGQPKFSRPMHPQSRPQARPAERGSAPDTQGMTRMMMRKTRMMMMLMEALPMARETHVQTVVVSTGLVISGYSATSVIPGMMASVYR
ncbi:TPA: hypothetical protein ACH3X2_003011 [Trebouxia sp. C0005]